MLTGARLLEDPVDHLLLRLYIFAIELLQCILHGGGLVLTGADILQEALIDGSSRALVQRVELAHQDLGLAAPGILALRTRAQGALNGRRGTLGKLRGRRDTRATASAVGVSLERG